MNPSKDFLVVGGEGKSETDGDIHYINAHKLCKLYGLDPYQENVICAESRMPITMLGIRKENYIILRPKKNGNYDLESEIAVTENGD